VDPPRSGGEVVLTLEGLSAKSPSAFGMPLRDISPVVESLTEKPLTVLASHLHYDHVGNHHRFERVAMPDLPVIRDRIDGEWLTPSRYQYMGFVEDWQTPRWRVSEFLPAGAKIELGGRTLEVLYTPGHTDDSISLWDAKRELLFSGDYIYEGALYAFLPNSSLREYLAAAEHLLSIITDGTRILSAHRITPPGPPILARKDLLDLRKLLIAIRDGEADYAGFFPARYQINDRLTLETDVPIFHDLR
jgi:glyoxylase-like metal-dependent hydrolase (beta-lactamase superfamily II)